MGDVRLRNKTAGYINETVLMGSIKLDPETQELQVDQEGLGPVKMMMSYTKGKEGDRFLYCTVAADTFDQALENLKSCKDAKKPLSNVLLRNLTYTRIGDITRQELMDIVSPLKPKVVYVSSELVGDESIQLTLTYQDSADRLTNLCTGTAKLGERTCCDEAFEVLKKNCAEAASKKK